MTAAGKITEVKNGRICIIDPDDTLFQSINGALKSMGYETTSAKTGLEGLERIRHSFYELIIVAAAMPDMNVAEFLRNMREVQHDVNIPSSFVIIVAGDDYKT
ncbi:MAG: response regulator, partial [Elusimicrobiota bacterium]